MLRYNGLLEIIKQNTNGALRILSINAKIYIINNYNTIFNSFYYRSLKIEKE